MGFELILARFRIDIRYRLLFPGTVKAGPCSQPARISGLSLHLQGSLPKPAHWFGVDTLYLGTWTPRKDRSRIDTRHTEFSFLG